MMYVLDLFGVAVFAVAGALVAARKRMDAFGVIVVALVTALGGGTLRDLVLGAKGVFWVSDPNYVVLGACAAAVAFVLARHYRLHGTALLVADGLGLAVFTVIGVRRGLDAGAPGVIAVLLGVMTGVAGGIIRDVLCGEVPLILRKEVYATASLAGAVVYALLHGAAWARPFVGPAAMVMVLVIRLAAIRWRLALPMMVSRDGEQDAGAGAGAERPT